MMYHLPGIRSINSNEERSPFGEVLMKLAHQRGIETLPEIGDAAEARGYLFAWEEVVGLVYGGPGLSPRPGTLTAIRDALELTGAEDAMLRGALMEYMFADPERLPEHDQD